MKSALTVMLVSSFVLGLRGFPIVAQTAGVAAATCMPPDATTTAMLAGLRRLATSSAPEFVESREWRKIPKTQPSSVSYVTDNGVCNSAEAAYTAAAALEPPATPSGMVRVFKLGNVFVVQDTAQQTGEYIVTMTLSKSFKVLARYRL